MTPASLAAWAKMAIASRLSERASLRWTKARTRLVSRIPNGREVTLYSHGVLFDELLTGATPFDKERLETATNDESRHIVREEEPPRPSQ